MRMDARLRLIATAMIALLGMSTAQATTTLELATFNIRWFGDTGAASDEPAPNIRAQFADPKARFEAVRDFIATVIKPKDVIAFNEIVDQDLLMRALPRGWNCVGYKHAEPRHQHVMLCASTKYKLVPVPYDDNAIIEDVAMANRGLRPAVRVDLADANGKRLLRIIAVHLKAMPAESKKRAEQASLIAKDLSSDNKVPTVIMGDMNTYFPAQTRLPQSDLDIIETQLDRFDTSFHYLKHKDQYTYRTDRYRSQFDQVFINDQVRVVAGPEVFSVCNATKDGDGYMNFAYYYEFISNHCPVRVQLAVP